MKTCRQCRFCQMIGKGRRGEDQPEVDVGACRINPPVAAGAGHVLPTVSLDEDWCGELKPRRWRLR